MQLFLTEQGHRIPVILELVPDLFIETAMTREASNAPFAVRWVEGGQVGELHRQAVRSPSKELSNLHDSPISRVHPPKRKRKVKPARDDKLLTRP